MCILCVYICIYHTLIGFGNSLFKIYQIYNRNRNRKSSFEKIPHTLFRKKGKQHYLFLLFQIIYCIYDKVTTGS